MATSTSKPIRATSKTSTRRATPAKSTPAKSITAKTASKTINTTTNTTTGKTTSTAPLPKVVTVSGPVVSEPDMRKKELIDLVVTRSGIKKKDAKPVVESVLAILGESIADGRELNLQPFGKLRINRTEEKPNGRVIVCKLRQSTLAKSAVIAPVVPAAE